jgi:hypothetical protein
MVTKSEWGQIIRELPLLSARLADTVSGLSKAEPDRMPNDGGWTIRQIIHHLSDSVSIWGGFVRQALAGRGGEFYLRWYLDLSQDEWAGIWNYGSRDIEPALDLYRATLAHMASLLSEISDPDKLGLEISWTTSEKELVSLKEIVSFQPEHLAGHLEDIKALLHQPHE